MNYEENQARMEGLQSVHEENYFKARPELMSRENRRIFCSAFERGWNSLRYEYEQLERKLKALEEKLKADTVAAAEVSPAAAAAEGTPECKAKEAANVGAP